jgi:hypothetical protein
MRQTLSLALLTLAACGPALAQTAPPAPGPAVIAPDDGGAPGYQHSIERSRFVLGGTASIAARRVEENGFSKAIGENGVVAVDRRNGLFIAVENGGGDKEKAAPQLEGKAPVMDPDRHNGQVAEYFRGAGVPKEQIGGVHATTYLSSHGSVKDERPAAPKIDGYASVLERKIDGVPVVDSVAWARLNERGEVISEWVYWPAIPAKAIADAKKMLENAAKPDFMARLPAGLPAGRVVIRHTSATSQAPFEAFASYDVVERRATPAPTEKNLSVAPSGVAILRHFDAEGAEQRLPQEKLDLSSAYPAKEKRPVGETKEK